MSRSAWPVRASAVVLAWLVAALVVGVRAGFADIPIWLPLHLLLLGAISNAILIWSSHVTAALLRLPAVSRHPEETARLALFNAGAVTVVVGMTVVNVPETSWAIVIAGAAVIGEVAIWHGIVIARRVSRAASTAFGAVLRYYVAAAGLLPLGIYVGVLLVPDDLPESTHARLALAHVGLNVLGWLGLTALGTVTVLWPTMMGTRVPVGAARSARTALPVLAGGVALIVGGAVTGHLQMAVLGIACYLAAVVLIAVPAARVTRRPPAMTYAALSVLAAMLWLAGSAAALGVLLASAPDWESAAAAADRLAEPVVIGFAAQFLVGTLCLLAPARWPGALSDCPAGGRHSGRLAPPDHRPGHRPGSSLLSGVDPPWGGPSGMEPLTWWR